MLEDDLSIVVTGFVEYYNTQEYSCWTCDKAYKRIHQVMTTEDSMCLVICDENGEIVGFLMGYMIEYADITGYRLDEIVIFDGHHNKGYGTALICELIRRLKEVGVKHISLESVNDELHNHFYSKLGFYKSSDFIPMGIFFE